MNKEFEGHHSAEPDHSDEASPTPRRTQGNALQVNENSAGGKKPASSQPTDAAEPTPHKGQGKALQVNENSTGK
jgi:hypothetical protein